MQTRIKFNALGILCVFPGCSELPKLFKGRKLSAVGVSAFAEIFAAENSD